MLTPVTIQHQVVRPYWEWSKIYWCQEMEEESRRQIRMGCHSEGGTGETIRAVRQWIIIQHTYTFLAASSDLLKWTSYVKYHSYINIQNPVQGLRKTTNSCMTTTSALDAIHRGTLHRINCDCVTFDSYLTFKKLLQTNTHVTTCQHTAGFAWRSQCKKQTQNKKRLCKGVHSACEVTTAHIFRTSHFHKHDNMKITHFYYEAGGRGYSETKLPIKTIRRHIPLVHIRRTNWFFFRSVTIYVSTALRALKSPFYP
jgi:hypothetical protein